MELDNQAYFYIFGLGSMFGFAVAATIALFHALHAEYIMQKAK